MNEDRRKRFKELLEAMTELRSTVKEAAVDAVKGSEEQGENPALRLRAVMADLFDDKIIFYDPPTLDKAIIGYCYDLDRSAYRMVYSRDKMIEVFTEEFDGDHEGAVEWYDFNVAGGWLGDNTPVLMNSIEDLVDDL